LGGGRELKPPHPNPPLEGEGTVFYLIPPPLPFREGVGGGRELKPPHPNPPLEGEGTVFYLIPPPSHFGRG